MVPASPFRAAVQIANDDSEWFVGLVSMKQLCVGCVEDVNTLVLSGLYHLVFAMHD